MRELPEEQLHEQSVECIVRRANHSPTATQGGRRSYYGVGRRSQEEAESGEEKGEEDERGNEGNNTSGYEEAMGHEERIITTQSAE